MSNVLKAVLLSFAEDELEKNMENATEQQIEEAQQALNSKYSDQKFVNFFYWFLSSLEVNDTAESNTIQSYKETDIVLSVDITLMTLPLMIGILFLMFTRKRKHLLPNCLNGHFALLVPVNFLEDRKRRKALVAAFALITMNVIDVLGADLTSGGVYLKVIEKLFFVSFVGMRFLPLFACVHLASFAGCVVGLLYLFLIICVNILKQIPAPGMPQGVVFKELFIPTVVHVIAGGYLFYWFTKYLIKHCRKKVVNADIELKPDLKYMKNLLLPKRIYEMKKRAEEEKIKLSTNKRTKLVLFFRKHVYRKVPGFRYALTILVSCTIGFLCITQLCVTRLYELTKDLIDCLALLEQIQSLKSDKMPNFVAMIIKLFIKTGKKNSDDDSDGKNMITVYSFVYTQSLVILVGSLLAGIIAYLLSTITICHMLMTYRNNVLNLSKQKSNQNILQIEKDYSNISLVRSAIQFGGYQVAYIIAGFIIQSFVLVSLFLFLGEIIVIPIQFAFKNFVTKFLEIVGPFIIALILIQLTQYLLIRFLFLEDRGKTMALNNRRGFFIMTYFVFFHNIFTGVFSCAKRIVKGTFIGIILLPRLDKSIFPRTFEEKDSVFKAYSCLLHLEALQSNPIVRSFAYLMLKSHASSIYHDPQNYYETNVPLTLITPKEKRLAQIRWFVAYTLVKNPSIVFNRKMHDLSVLDAYSKSPVLNHRAMGKLNASEDSEEESHERKYLNTDDSDVKV